MGWVICVALIPSVPYHLGQVTPPVLQLGKVLVGTSISHYKVTEKIGEGGMGEVYLAEDSRLDRKVALKIFPDQLSERADLRSALNAKPGQ